MGAASRATRRIMLWLASVAQIGIAIAIIYFVRRLQDLEVSAEDQEIVEVRCSLNAGLHSNQDGDPEEDSLCLLAFAGVGITFALLLGLSIILCFTCELCGAGWILEVAVQAILCVGWVMYASWVTSAARTIDDWDVVPVWDTDRVQNARSSVVVLSWAEALLTGVSALTIFLSSCCCCTDDK